MGIIQSIPLPRWQRCLGYCLSSRDYKLYQREIRGHKISDWQLIKGGLTREQVDMLIKGRSLADPWIVLDKDEMLAKL